MQGRNDCDSECADLISLIGFEFNKHTVRHIRASCHIHCGRASVDERIAALGNKWRIHDMIMMCMRNKDRFLPVDLMESDLFVNQIVIAFCT